MLAVCGTQVGAHDDRVDILEASDCLEFDDDLVENEQVQAMKPNLYPTVNHWNGNLSFERNVLGPQLDSERVFVNRLEKTGPSAL